MTARPRLFAIALLLPISGWSQEKVVTTSLPGGIQIIPSGASISVRIDGPIVSRTDSASDYAAQVAQDVVDQNGRVLITKGANARLFVQKLGADGNLVLSLESVTVNGEKYSLLATNTTQNKSAGMTHGSRIDVPAGSVLNFRLDNPFMVIAPGK